MVTHYNIIAWLAAATLNCALPALAQTEYPTKPLRIVTSSAGGSSDFVSRLIAQALAAPLGQQVIVENRPGGVQNETVAKSAPDGYTVLFSGGALAVLPLMRKTPYDPIRDFAPITLVALSTNVVAAHPSLPVTSIKELIALATARPGAINYATSGRGSTGHLAAELFNYMAKVNIVHIPYKGNGPALTDLVGGHVQLIFASAPALIPHLKSNRIRPLAVTSRKPSALVPGLPTIADAGLRGYEADQMQSMLAPARTPEAIVKRLNHEIVRVITAPDVKAKLMVNGAEAVGSSPEELMAAMKAEIARMEAVIQRAGIRDE